MIKGIVCIGANGVMGKDGTMPWGDKPLDGKHFRSLTEGQTVVMGRKTYEGMGCVPLPNRENIVISANPLWVFGLGIKRAHSITPIVVKAKREDLWVIGGAQLFKALLPFMSEIYVTTVGDSFEGDTYFPDIHKDYKWDTELLGTENKDGRTLVYRKFTKQ